MTKIPYTDEFKKIRRRFSNMYSDKAKAETFAFEEAFKSEIPTFSDKKKIKFKRQEGGFII